MSDKNPNSVIHDLILVHSTNAAYLIKNTEGDKVWIPKSQVYRIDIGADVRDDSAGVMVKEIDTIELPTWLAKKNSLV